MYTKEPVIAAIPAYNEELNIAGLLRQVLEEGYDEVYVLDDASTDHTVEAVQPFGKDIILVRGKENLGSGANRNRIIPALGHSALIHFLDADVKINSINTPDIARELGSMDGIGFVGGLIRSPDGTPHPWNYGPPFSLPQMASGWVYSAVYNLGKQSPERVQKARQLLNRWALIEQWPDPLAEPTSREVYWSGEANMVIPSAVFSAVGGYDPAMRYHEVMELAMRLDRLGLKRFFNPAIDVTHADLDCLNKGNTREFYKAQAHLIGKMGLRKFIFPDQAITEPV